MKVREMKLPTGYTAISCSVPDDWWLGEKKVLCGCDLRLSGLFPFIKEGKLWIRVRHAGGAGFCEFEAISDDRREQRAGRLLHPSLRNR